MLNFVTLSLIKLHDAIVSSQQQKEQMQTLLGRTNLCLNCQAPSRENCNLCAHGSLNLTEYKKRRSVLVPEWDCGSHLVIYIFSLVTSDCHWSSSRWRVPKRSECSEQHRAVTLHASLVFPSVTSFRKELIQKSI